MCIHLFETLYISKLVTWKRTNILISLHHDVETYTLFLVGFCFFSNYVNKYLVEKQFRNFHNSTYMFCCALRAKTAHEIIILQVFPNEFLNIDILSTITIYSSITKSTITYVTSLPYFNL